MKKYTYRVEQKTTTTAEFTVKANTAREADLIAIKEVGIGDFYPRVRHEDETNYLKINEYVVGAGFDCHRNKPAKEVTRASGIYELKTAQLKKMR